MLPGPKLIKKLRQINNISQQELANITNLTQSTISRIENGDVDPPYSKYKKILEVLLSNPKLSRYFELKCDLEVLLNKLNETL